MTHDELLELLTPTLTQSPWERLKNPTSVMPALRAVVELHKPEETQAKSVFWCKVCMGHDELDGTYRLFYPCPTIQAIEKELK